MKQVIDQGNGVRTHVSVEDGNLITGTVQDCDAILDHAKALHREGHHGSSEMKHAAKLPFVAIEQYCNRLGITFEEFMRERKHVRAMLNDPDLSGFRIWPGRV